MQSTAVCNERGLPVLIAQVCGSEWLRSRLEWPTTMRNMHVLAGIASFPSNRLLRQGANCQSADNEADKSDTPSINLLCCLPVNFARRPYPLMRPN
jgi:hypothetical protein